MINVTMIQKQLVAGVDEQVDNAMNKDIETMTNEEAVAHLAVLRARLEAVETTPVVVTTKVKKNHRMGKVAVGRTYTRLGSLDAFGKVPQQQQDIAALLSRFMAVGVPYTEQEVFDMLIDNSGDYKSLVESDQHVTYLFRYYRGLKNNGKHAGFVARNFIRQNG